MWPVSYQGKQAISSSQDFLFNYAVEMGSRAVIYVPSLIKIGSGIQKLIRGYTDTNTHIQTAR
jgi:hypothetical protein